MDWDGYRPPIPAFTGTMQISDVTVATLRNYIDWKPFFITWEMHGNYPEILDDPMVGAEARKLQQDAIALLDQI